MSGQLESALVLKLVDSIKWESALIPTHWSGRLNQVDPDKPLDVTQYARRDRELAYRDMQLAAAVLKVSLETETVWNASALRPKVEGLASENLPFVIDDTGRTNGQVIHVKNSSVPADALQTDKDLAGRDDLLLECLARACTEFVNPPLTPNDSSGTLIPGTSAWSLGEASASRSDINTALPLNTNLFKRPDQNLADRDNQIAAYVARLVQIIKNPFSYASRIYVRIDGADERELEVYSLIRVPYTPGNAYNLGDEVFYGTSWYQAIGFTAALPTDVLTWKSIRSPRYRIFTAEPALEGRNRIVYDCQANTLKWVTESATVLHPPQIAALSIPGPLTGQTITTVAGIPQSSDAQFWRQKAGRITYEGTLSEHVAGYHSTLEYTGGGVLQTDTMGLTAAGACYIPFEVSLAANESYRMSALVKPSQSISLDGAHNIEAQAGTLSGVTFSGVYAPTSTSPGKPISYALSLPAGAWALSLEYANLSDVPTTGFGAKIRLNGAEIREDTTPLPHQDAVGAALPVGQLVKMPPVNFTATGSQDILDISWTYGGGQFHVRRLLLETKDRRMGRYSMQVDLGQGLDLLKVNPTVDVTGEKDIYGVMQFDFIPKSTRVNPDIYLRLNPATNILPLQVRQVQLEKVVRKLPVPEAGRFYSWKQECLDRAERSVLTSFNKFLSGQSMRGEALPEFTTDGTLWDHSSTEKWMNAIEVYEPRLREIQDVSTVIDGHQYIVSSGSVVYNSGTYALGQKFFGTNVSNFVSHGAQLDQIGAFVRSYPGNVGRPALLPFGLWFDGKDIRQANPTRKQIPMVVALQPWMVEAGLYVAQEEFWSVDTVTGGIITSSASSIVYPDGVLYAAGFREGSVDEAVFELVASESVSFASGSLFEALVSAGTFVSGNGTVAVSFDSGTIAEVIVSAGTFSAGGTLATGGTNSVAFDSGTLVNVVVSVGTTFTGGGTTVVSFDSGVLFDATVEAGGVYEDFGTLTVGFYVGTYV